MPDQATSYQGERIFEIFQQGASITYDNHTLVMAEIKKIFDVFLEVRGGSSKGAPKLELFVQCLKRVFGESSESRCLAKAQSYRVHLTANTPANYKSVDNGGRTLSYWCFSPSEAMRELANLNIRSILVTSGTLSPMESYALELDIPFPNRLENPHIISPHQIYVRVMGRGVSNKELTSSYERRQNNEYYIELGNTLASLSCVVPCGMLVFFPSYGVMETSIERWGGPTSSRSSSNSGNASSFFSAKKYKSGALSGNTARYSFPHQAMNFSFDISQQTHSTPWKRLLSHKAIVIEPKATSDLPDAIAEFHKFLNKPKSKGVMLFGVCRGKISEGIDFSHDMCRAVIITGLPFAPTFDPKVKMKREYLDQKKAKQKLRVSTSGGFGSPDGSGSTRCLSGHAWYTQQAHRAVNQAIGRVIRNKRDYGAVILMDSRFGLPGNQKGLSKWIRPHILPEEGFGEANQKLAQFYRKAKESSEIQAATMITSKAVATKSTNVSVILKYEDEENDPKNMDTIANEANITKVAYIKNDPIKNGRNDDIENDSHDNYVDPQRILARIEIDQISRQEEQRSFLTQSASHLQQTQQNSAKELSKSSSICHQRKTIGTMKENPRSSPALQFFHIIRSTLTNDEFDSVKKNIGLMKKFSERKFRKRFIVAARLVIKIIISHEPFHNRAKKQKPKLLCLLFEFLPKHFLNDVQQATVDSVFRTSTMRKELKAILTSHEYVKVHVEFVEFLQEVWFKETTNNLEGLQRLERLLTRCHKVSKLAMSEFVDFLPFEIQRQATAIVEEKKAAIDVSKIIAEEKYRVKESVIRSEYFRKNFDNSMKEKLEPTKQERSQTQANKSIQIQKRMLSHPNLEQSCKKMKTMKNPYAKNTNKSNLSLVVRDNVFASCKNNVVGEKSRLSDTTSKNDSNVELICQSISAPTSSLEKILRESGSDTFASGMKKKRRTIISSNAPKNMTCTLCNQLIQKLYISECGHIACLQCWHKWLDRSDTCPQCRNPVSITSIALAVFKGET